MITVRDLQELLDKLPKDMQLYWVVDGKFPEDRGDIKDIPLWISIVPFTSGKLAMAMLGMHYPTYIKEDQQEGKSCFSLYSYVHKYGKKSRWSRIKDCFKN